MEPEQVEVRRLAIARKKEQKNQLVFVISFVLATVLSTFVDFASAHPVLVTLLYFADWFLWTSSLLLTFLEYLVEKCTFLTLLFRFIYLFVYLVYSLFCFIRHHLEVSGELLVFRWGVLFALVCSAYDVFGFKHSFPIFWAMTPLFVLWMSCLIYVKASGSRQKQIQNCFGYLRLSGILFAILYLCYPLHVVALLFFIVEGQTYLYIWSSY